jgi:hypothetical protein
VGIDVFNVCGFERALFRNPGIAIDYNFFIKLLNAPAASPFINEKTAVNSESKSKMTVPIS